MKQGFIFLLLLVPAFSMFNWNDPDGQCFWYERTFKGLDPISKPVHVDSAKECQAACKEAATEGECCDFFSYNHDTGHCFLWNANVTLVKHHVDTSKQNVSWTAGPRSCDGCFFPGMVNAPGIRDFPNVPCADDCQRRCQEFPGCGYWAYRPWTRQCWIKWPEVTGVTNSGEYAYFLSGPRSCVGCFSTGQGYSSDGCAEVVDDVPSAILCQFHCAIHKECVSFTYFPAECKCQLNTPMSVEKVDPDAISGPKYCPNCDCFKDN